MKRFLTVIVTMIVTAAILMVVALVKFGSVNVQTHTDEYVTTCNGVVVDSHENVVTDRVDFSVNINEGFNLFSR